MTIMDFLRLNIGNLASNEGLPKALHSGTELHTAAVNGDKLKIERLLKQQDSPLDDGDKNGRTALVYAVFGDWYECAEILVRHGCHILHVDQDQRSVLHWTAYLGRQKFLKLFLDNIDTKNTVWNSRDGDGRTPLHYAAVQVNAKCLRLLLKHLAAHKSTVNLQDNERMSALHWSAFYNRFEHVKLLIQEAADKNLRDIHGRSLLHVTVLNPGPDSVRIVRLLLKLNPHCSKQKDRDGLTPLHLAVAIGNAELVWELCMAEETALNEVDASSRSVLHYAVLKRDTKIVQILINAGVSPYYQDKIGATVLHYAAKNNCADIVNRLLIGYKNFEDTTDNEGRTALMWAANLGAKDVLSLMLENSSFFNVHAGDNEGLTGLHYACLAGHTSCVQLLLDNKVDLSQPDKYGQTAFFKACQQGHYEILDLLTQNNHNAMTSLSRKEVNSTEDTEDDNERDEKPNEKQEKFYSDPQKLSVVQEETMDKISDGKGLLPGGYISRHRGQTSDVNSCDTYDFQENIADDKRSEGVKSGIKTNGVDFTNTLRPSIKELEDDNGCTPLHFAAHAGHEHVCQWLLRQGADPGKKDKQGRTPLHGAGLNGHTDCMALLLYNNPELVNDCDNLGYSTLHHAAAAGHLEAVKLLVSNPLAMLSFRAKPNNWTPLDYAMANDHQDVTQFLMDNGALTIARVQELAADTIIKFFRRYLVQRHKEKVQPLIERHRKLTKEESLKYENSKMLKKDSFYSDNTDGASRHGDNDVIKHTQSKKDDTGSSTVKSTTFTSNDDQLRTRTSSLGEIQGKESSKLTSLLEACYHGDLEKVETILRQKIDVNSQDEDCHSALHVAAEQGHEEICRYLLQLGAEAKKGDAFARTALHVASIKGHRGCISVLLQKNKEIISLLDCEGRSSLHYAAKHGHLDSVKLLMSHSDEQLNACATCPPLTILDCAILNGHDDIVKYLTGRGAVRGEILHRAARVIQRNVRKWLRRKNAQASLKEKCTGKATDHTTSMFERHYEKHEEVHDNVQKMTSGIQTMSFLTHLESHETPEDNQNSWRRDKNTSARQSKHSLEVQVSEHEKRDVGARDFSEQFLIPLHSDLKHFPKPPKDINRKQTRAFLTNRTTVAQINVAKLSRAPDSIVTSSDERDKILKLREEWERIALLRRRRIAAIILQRYFRKRLTNMTSIDNNSRKECHKSEENRKNDVKQGKTTSAEQKFENVRGLDLIKEKKKGPQHCEQNKPLRKELTSAEKWGFGQSAVCSKNTPRKGMRPEKISPLSTEMKSHRASPSVDGSGRETSRQRRQYKSAFPLLSSPTSSSSSSNEKLPSHREIAMATRSHLTTNDLVAEWLAKESVAKGETLPQKQTTAQSVEQSKLKPPMQDIEKSSSVPLCGRHTDLAESTIPERQGARGRRWSSVSARQLRRDSLIKNAYGSPAAQSYNFALDTYHPLASRRGRKQTAFPFRTSSRVRPNSMKRVEGGWVHTVHYARAATSSDSSNKSR